MFPEKTCFGMNCVPKSSRQSLSIPLLKRKQANPALIDFSDGIIRVGDKVHVLKSFEKKEDGSFARPEDSLLA